MSKYIIKYGRDDRVKFISHLDFMRVFHRAVRRSELTFEFSQGFNPHPLMQVAQPLPVAVTSECDYMKVGFVTEMNPNLIVKELNRVMPPGFKIYGCKKLKAKEIDINLINSAEYRVEIECVSPCDTEKFMANNELTVPKKTKSGVKDSDIRPYIYSLENLGFENGVQTVKMHVSCGGGYNLRPETVVEAMKKYSEGFEPTFTAVHRLSMLIDNQPVM